MLRQAWACVKQIVRRTILPVNDHASRDGGSSGLRREPFRSGFYNLKPRYNVSRIADCFIKGSKAGDIQKPRIERLMALADSQVRLRHGEHLRNNCALARSPEFAEALH